MRKHKKQPDEGIHQGGFSVPLRNYMKDRIYQKLLKNTFAIKRYNKGLLVQIKEEVYKIITNKKFTKEEDSPFEKVELHKNFNTQWETVYSRDLVEFTKRR